MHRMHGMVLFALNAMDIWQLAVFLILLHSFFARFGGVRRALAIALRAPCIIQQVFACAWRISCLGHWTHIFDCGHMNAICERFAANKNMNRLRPAICTTGRCSCSILVQ